MQQQRSTGKYLFMYSSLAVNKIKAKETHLRLHFRIFVYRLTRIYKYQQRSKAEGQDSRALKITEAKAEAI